MELNTNHPKFDLGSELLCSLTSNQYHAAPLNLLAEDLFGDINKTDEVMELIYKTRRKYGILIEIFKGHVFINKFYEKKHKDHTTDYWNMVYA